MRTDDARYQYSANYIPDFAAFRDRVLTKTVVPYQVEIQPGPAGSRLCWLSCPYCYGGSASDTGKRLSRDQHLKIIEEMASGGVNKVIFAGYATDPLFAQGIEDILDAAIQREMIVGFSTKALHVSRRFMESLCSEKTKSQSYVNVSVDAGSDEIYNAVHGVTSPASRLYERVRGNVGQLAWRRDGAGWGRNGRPFEIAATYLVNRLNADEKEIRRFVADFRRAGCDVIRFTFPQLPRGKAEGEFTMLLGREECTQHAARLRPLAAELDSERCRVLFVDADQEHDLFRKARTLPCVARFVYPTIGFDGWLYPCSQSAAPNFREMALGNLAERSFWDCYYDYDPAELEGILAVNAALMDHLDCRCDRKEHLVNAGIARSGAFAETLAVRA